MERVLVLACVLGAVAEGATLADTITRGPLHDLLDAAGLLPTLADPNGGPYTLFVPSDLYLYRYLSSQGLHADDLKQNVTKLKDFLLYHVVNGTIERSELYNEKMLTALNGKPIRVNNYSDRRLTVQGVVLQNRDRHADNGVIHYLYAPMTPDNGSVADVITGRPELSTLLAAAKAAGLVEFLMDQNPITVFAPTNAAFAKLGDDKVQALLADPATLAQILQYHVVPGTLYTAGVHTDDLHTFEEADRVHISSRFGQSFNVDNGHMRRDGDDLSATNGVVHEIDNVLVPASLKGQL